jgi:hypothetical protein
MKKAISPSMIAVCLTVTACVGGGGNEGSMVTAMTGMRTALGTTPDPRPDDYNFTCAEIQVRLTNLEDRYDEITKERKAEARKKNLLSGLVQGTIGVVGGAAGLNAGSVSGVQAAGAASNVAATYRHDLVNSEGDGESLKAITELQPIAERMGQLSKVKVEKGC